jgi:hypothetical protein
MDPRSSGVGRGERLPRRTIGGRHGDRPVITDELDHDLDARLAALEARVPTDTTSPPLPSGDRRAPRMLLSMATAAVLVLVVGATALAGAAASGLIAFGHPGVENPGQPLEDARLECMAPPQAAAYLAEHGFTDVVWQIETTGKQPGVAKAPSLQTRTPPAHGYVIPGSIVDGQLIMVVDQRPGATGTGACPDLPMP